ncbi:MAG: methyltransferase domain-containing protein [Aggregatilineales bacterium]
MIPIGGLALVALIAGGAIALGWWLFVETEGAYLGRRVVVWLYDLYAQRYDSIKRYNQVHEHALLAQPIMERIAPLRAPLVLDVATGTGRLPLALLSHAHFQGRIVAVDLSRAMLARAADKLAEDAHRVALVWCPAETLPFADDLFDLVTCLESLEFMASPTAALRELIRVLRPGGLLLFSQRINTPWMPGRAWTREQLVGLLSPNMAEAEVEPWQTDYHRVWARKAGNALPAGPLPLGEILRCPCCGALMAETLGGWTCSGCGGVALVGVDGVIELERLRRACS